MRHTEVRKKLFDYLQGMLDKRDRERLESHIAGCPACRQAVEEARELDLLLRREMPEARGQMLVPTAFEARLKAFLHSAPSPGPRSLFPPIFRNRYVWAGVGLCLAIAIILGALLSGPGLFVPPEGDGPWGLPGHPGTAARYIWAGLGLCMAIAIILVTFLARKRNRL
ncbi:MAG: zf-HC2 domain-containing protein [Dehalococcoidia bacterium]|nr:zf-HC2 domain-containing protein [Dehalococcoidia bacterium]